MPEHEECLKARESFLAITFKTAQEVVMNTDYKVGLLQNEISAQGGASSHGVKEEPT